MKRELLICLLLAAITFAAFAQTLRCEFINFDDDQYVTGNVNLRAGLTWQGIHWAFTATMAATWQPLVWLSFIVDRQLYGLNAYGYHLTNLLLHIANALLLFVVLNCATGYRWRSAFVAALFAIHPLHVESVAWVTERKDVLSTFFWMLAMLAYVWYVRRPAVGRYLLVVLLFALGIMSKPMLVTLPIMLLLMDYWPLGRLDAAQSRPSTLNTQRSTLNRLVLEKLPLFAISAASSAITYIVQRKFGAVSTLQDLTIGIRASNALVAYTSYIGKMIWPRNLAIFYPHPLDTLPLWKVAGAGLLLIAISVLVIRAARSRPYIAMGWLWYLVTLLPVIGLVQTGAHAMADRFTYVPLIGLFVIVAWGIPDSLAHARISSASRYLPASACVIIVALMISTWIHVGYWRNSITLYEHALAITTGNYVAHDNLAAALLGQKRYNEAIHHYKKALEIDTGNAELYSNIGLALTRMGRLEDAMRWHQEAVRIQPSLASAHYNLGLALVKQGKAGKAIEEYRTAVRLQPDLAGAHNDLGFALAKQGMMDEAMAHFRAAIRANPDFAEAHFNLASVLAPRGKLDEAIPEYIEAIRLKPRLAKAHKELAIALFFKGDYAGAWREVRLCRKYGGRPHPIFLRDLSRKMPAASE